MTILKTKTQRARFLMYAIAIFGTIGVCITAALIVSAPVIAKADSENHPTNKSRLERRLVPRELFASKIIRGGEPAEKISVNIETVEYLSLVADNSGDGIARDNAVWGEPILTASDGSSIRLSQLTPVSVKVGWGRFLRDANPQGEPLQVADQKFEHGLYAHAPSEIGYKLDKKYLRLETWIGNAASDGNKGAIQFKVIDRKDRSRKALVSSNPLLKQNPILFVTRPQYLVDHHNTETFFQTGEVSTSSFKGGGALKIIDFANDGQVTTLLEVPEGIIRDPDVSFDGEKILFSMRKNIEDDYHIYEIQKDGSNLKQLTFGREISDIDPIYMPDNSIVFTSTREPKYCQCNINIMGNLFKMDADGANIHQIDRNTLFSSHSSLLPDGRILYDRWEYVDRNFGDAQGLWTVNPDGTNHALYWGNNTRSPGGVFDARAIPGTQQVVCILGSCHDLPWGALAIVDRRMGLDGRKPVVRTWPAYAIDWVISGTDEYGDYDTFTRLSPFYEDPYPLNDTCFLVTRTIQEHFPPSRNTGLEHKMGIYYIDTYGNEILLHAEEKNLGCFDPMPLASRPRPPVIPERRNYENNMGTFYVVDVYEGTHMNNVKRGDVKSLRVVEVPPKKSWAMQGWYGNGNQMPGMNWVDFNNKKILGTVPVEKDGSAYFEVPSDKFVFFQLLDKDGMMIHSMRSGTMVQSAEMTGCIGCHEERRTSVSYAVDKTPLALTRPASKLQGWYGTPRAFSYMKEVQPVFDRNCMSCHDFGKEAETKLILAGDRELTFNASYVELWRKRLITCVGAGPAEVQDAYSWGSHPSKLVQTLRKGHHDIQLSKEEFDRIVTWIDINAPYYSTYDCAYENNFTGRSPLNQQQITRLGELTGINNIWSLGSVGRQLGPQISFDRPEISPCLNNIQDKESPEYQEALGIIQAGKEMLAKKPRADMDGFVPCQIDQLRHRKYDALQQIEQKAREAIRNGEKYNSKDAEWPLVITCPQYGQ